MSRVPNYSDTIGSSDEPFDVLVGSSAPAESKDVVNTLVDELLGDDDLTIPSRTECFSDVGRWRESQIQKLILKIARDIKEQRRLAKEAGRKPLTVFIIHIDAIDADQDIMDSVMATCNSGLGWDADYSTNNNGSFSLTLR